MGELSLIWFLAPLGALHYTFINLYFFIHNHLAYEFTKALTSYLLTCSLVVDGNFHADHICMKKPEDDIQLADGLGYMVASAAYQKHLSTATDMTEVMPWSPLFSWQDNDHSFQKSTCHNYRANNRPSSTQKDLESTGIGACACSRHGCFVPHSVVDFQKGEKFVLTTNFICIHWTCSFRQMNMDYSICHALQYKTSGLNHALVIYDIACQYFRHFFSRVECAECLKLGFWDEFILAVGKWHLSSHVPSCFARYSLNFIKGAGQQDGEILETLWAEFNKVSTSARTMSKAHHAEVYDDHMHDSNWQKIVSICMSQTLLSSEVLIDFIQQSHCGRN